MVGACWGTAAAPPVRVDGTVSDFGKLRKSPDQNHKTIPRIVKPGRLIVLLDRGRSSGCSNWRRELCPSRTAAPCLQRGGGSRASALLYVVGRCRWSGYVAARWSRPTCVDFPKALPRETRARAPEPQRWRSQSGTCPNTAPKRHTSRAGARRARPVMWRHIGTFLLIENGCPALP